MKNKNPLLFIITGALAIVIAFCSILSSVYTVDAGETAILTRYGEIIDTKTSGLNWKSPMEDVTYFSTREQKTEFGSFDKQTGDVVSGLSAYTADRQTATVALTISYQISNPEEVYSKYKTTENMLNVLLAPKVRQQLEIVFSNYNSQTVIEKRAEFANTLRQQIAEVFKGYPLVINDVQAVFNFSKEYERRMEESINQDVAIRNKERETRIKAEEAKAIQIQVEADAKAQITRAEAEAKVKELNATAEAKGIELKGKAEADALKAKNEALSAGGKVAELVAAERWNGQLPAIVPQGQMLPFMNIPNFTATPLK